MSEMSEGLALSSIFFPSSFYFRSRIEVMKRKRLFHEFHDESIKVPDWNRTEKKKSDIQDVGVVWMSEMSERVEAMAVICRY
jgi:hypothetical protein